MPRTFRPMAIVAADCLLPGALDIASLWGLFDDERTMIGTAPEHWLDRSVYYDPDPQARNRSYCETVAVLPPWQPSRPFRLPPKQAAMLDPTHRLALEIGQRTVAAMEGVWLPRETTGVWIAHVSGAVTTKLREVAYHGSERWSRAAAAIRPDLAPAIGEFHSQFQARYPHPREEAAINSNILAGRVANYCDLQGPQMSLDAACASSLAALRNACLALEDGSCDMALVGAIGVQTPETLVVTAKAHAIAPGPSFPFDQAASGYVPGEGAVMVAVVRAQDARRRGLRTLGVIRSIGSSVNGRGTAPWSPSQDAEQLAIRRAWSEGELGPDERIDYIEAHGTATQVGDKTEHAAMLATYGSRAGSDPIPFASGKSVVGHTVDTAGFVGVLRALYLFERGRVPANVGVKEPAQFIREHADRLRLALRNEPLPPADGPRRVGVSSFGMGGINFHALLESDVAAPAEPITTRGSREPIAIVGVAGIMPGAADADAVWQHLTSGAAERSPLDGYIPDFASFYSPDVSRRDRTVSPVAAIVDPPVLREPGRWRILPSHTAGMSTDHLLSLNAASQLVAAGVTPSDPATRLRSGVFATDILDSDSRHALLRVLVFQRWWTELTGQLAGKASPEALAEISEALFADPDLALRAVTEDDSMAGQGLLGASRIATGLDMRGTAVSVNSACASGLAALTMGLQELRAGTLDFALVGGASLGVDETNQVALSAIGSLSASGRGRPYDKDADGFLIGSGGAWFALKRLCDAERDGDDILAVVRECGGTSDGKGKSILAPNVRGRLEVIRRTYARAGIDPRTVQYVEGHGAASALGDASEVEVIAEEMATGTRQVSLGSVKGNYGHLKGAAAFAGLLKVVLCLRNRTLVPTPGFSEPGDLAGVKDGRIRIVDKVTDWPRNDGHPRRAGINAFGLGGTNYHAIIDEYRKPGDENQADSPGTSEADRPGTSEADRAAGSPTATERGTQPPPTFRAAAQTAEQLADRLETNTQGGRGGWRAAAIPASDKAAQAQRGALAKRLRDTADRLSAEVTELGTWAGPRFQASPAVLLFPGQSGTQFFDATAWLATTLPAGPGPASRPPRHSRHAGKDLQRGPRRP